MRSSASVEADDLAQFVSIDVVPLETQAGPAAKRPDGHHVLRIVEAEWSSPSIPSISPRKSGHRACS